MALRIVDLPGVPSPSRLVHGSSDEVRELLRAGDVAAYRRRFDDAASLDHPHARYRARRDLIEGALAVTAEIPPAKLAQAFAAIAAGTLAALAEDAAEPVLLNHAGVALYELGELDSAELLFGAALRLDPELSHARGNLEQVSDRRRRGVPQLPALVTAALPELRSAVQRAASSARPAEGLKVSLCMIVKDEGEMLPRSLAAARDAVDEIIVVDTGSADDTIEIARSFGATVIEREWTGSFSDARNASFDAASGDWVIYLDADEVLVEDDAHLLRELAGRTWREAFYLVETNHTGELGDGTAVTHNALRMFRNRPEYRFEGRIHEQIAQNLPAGAPERLELSRVRVEHFGYLASVRDAKEKSRRNADLLERQLAETGPTPFLCFNLGSERAAAGDAEQARAQFEQAWGLLAADPERATYGYVPSLTSRLVKSLRLTGDFAGAAERADEGLALFPGFTDLVFEQAKCALDRGDSGRARKLFERCLEMGEAPSRYSPTVGCGTNFALLALGELHLAEGDLGAAEDALGRCLDEHPGFLGSIHPLAQAMLAGGKSGAEVRAHIEGGVDAVTPSVSFMLGTALYEAAHAAEALECFAAVTVAQPANGPARVAVAEAHLSLRNYDAAAAEAGRVDPADPCAAAACRTELFALIVGGRPAVAALGRAEAAGMDAAERALFAGWDAAVRLGSGFVPLDPAIVPLLVTVLEALLRVEEFVAFERLLPAVEAAGVPARERHELLAAVYLRRGFLESAADEWIAACEIDGPDPPALRGLARVAAAQGLAEEAQIFTEEAQRLASSSA